MAAIKLQDAIRPMVEAKRAHRAASKKGDWSGWANALTDHARGAQRAGPAIDNWKKLVKKQRTDRAVARELDDL